jgi:hypothetical protein
MPQNHITEGESKKSFTGTGEICSWKNPQHLQGLLEQEVTEWLGERNRASGYHDPALNYVEAVIGTSQDIEVVHPAAFYSISACWLVVSCERALCASRNLDETRAPSTSSGHHPTRFSFNPIAEACHKRALCANHLVEALAFDPLGDLPAVSAVYRRPVSPTEFGILENKLSNGSHAASEDY